MKRTIKLEIFMAFLLVFVVIFTVTVSITDEIISRYNESPYGWLNQNEIMKNYVKKVEIPNTLKFEMMNLSALWSASASS